MTYETYEMIAELLMAGTAEDPAYSVEEIADMVGVSVADVQYVDHAENDVM